MEMMRSVRGLTEDEDDDEEEFVKRDPSSAQKGTFLCSPAHFRRGPCFFSRNLFGIGEKWLNRFYFYLYIYMYMYLDGFVFWSLFNTEKKNYFIC